MTNSLDLNQGSVHLTNQKAKGQKKMPNIEVKQITKNVKLVTGTTVERKGKVSLAILRTPEEVQNLLGANMAVFAAFGYRAYLKQVANNAITGGGKKEKDLKSALRNFKTSVEVLKSTMDMDEKTSTELLLKKEQFAAVKTYLEAMEANTEAVTLDYSEKFPVPEFDAADDDSDEE
jgi:hypothetical protein